MPNLTILSLLPLLGITAAMAFLLPIAAIVGWRIRSRSRLLPFFVGGAIFFVAVGVLESLFHVVMLGLIPPTAAFLGSHPLAYSLYAALAAGVFEETGRYLAFSFFLKGHNEPETAITYGIGHGGFECILTVGVTYVSYMCIILLGAPGFEQILPTLVSMTPGLCTIAVLERLMAMVFHVCLSVWVFAAVHDPAKKHYYPLAILLHALLDIPAALYQMGVLPLLAVEGLILIYVAVVAVFTRRLYGQLPRML